MESASRCLVRCLKYVRACCCETESLSSHTAISKCRCCMLASPVYSALSAPAYACAPPVTSIICSKQSWSCDAVGPSTKLSSLTFPTTMVVQSPAALVCCAHFCSVARLLACQWACLMQHAGMVLQRKSATTLKHDAAVYSISVHNLLSHV